MTALGALQARLLQQGKVFSISRVVGYLIGFHEIIAKESFDTTNIAPPEKQCLAWMTLISRAMAYVPERAVPGRRRACYKASPEKRAYVTQQIIQRLGIKDPPRELVNYYLDKGGMDPMLSQHIAPLSDGDVQRLLAEWEAEKVLEASKKGLLTAESSDSTEDPTPSAPEPVNNDGHDSNNDQKEPNEP